jgi:dTDP-4-amino-4,6-dideoxygalactose transaminase
MIPLAVPNISGNEGAYLQDCVTSTFVSSVGPFVDRFEDSVAQATGAACAVATASGTTALHAALHDAGVGPGDHVIIPTLTFIATANAVAHCHAEPVLVDVDADRWCLDPVLVRDVLQERCARDADGVLRLFETGRPVKAMVPVFAMGMPADMDPLAALAREYGLALIVDAAAAIGATYKGRALADMGADSAMLSFNGNKLVTAGGGGALISARSEFGPRLRHLTSTARVGAIYDHDIVGFNYRMTNLQAAVGVAQIERLDEFLQDKARIAARYADAFADLDGVLAFPEVADSTSSYWLSGIFLPDATLDDMDALRARLDAAGAASRPFWKPIHQQAPFVDAPTALSGFADHVWLRVQPLPCSSHLTEAEQETVITAVRGHFGA